EVSGVFESCAGPTVLKCDQRIPARQDVTREAVHDSLVHSIVEQKTRAEIQKVFQTLMTEAHPQVLLKPASDKLGAPPPGIPFHLVGYTQPPDPALQPVAFIYNNIPITRGELAEFLIARYAEEKVDLLVNKRIIELSCKQRNISVNEEEVEA